jgi:hypothetical protein
MDDTELSERYVALWNEPDPATRSAQLRALWREDGRHLLQAPVDIRRRADALGFPKATLEVRGHEALEFRVGRAHAEFVAGGEHRFRGRGAPARVGESLRLQWEMIDRAGTVVGAGTEFLVLDPTGRIAADYQFIERVTEPESAGT